MMKSGENVKSALLSRNFDEEIMKTWALVNWFSYLLIYSLFIDSVSASEYVALYERKISQ
jgi:hypothetical protein